MFMALVYVADRILTISFNISTWLISKSAEGVHYIYKNVKGDSKYITITREEYDKLLQAQNNI
jgi:hypothetical protein